MRVEIISPEAVVFAGEANFVSLPGIAGSMGVLAGHQPLLTRLAVGYIHVKESPNGAVQASIYVVGGILEILPRSVSVLADLALDTAKLSAQECRSVAELARQIQQRKLEELNFEMVRLQLLNSLAHGAHRHR